MTAGEQASHPVLWGSICFEEIPAFAAEDGIPVPVYTGMYLFEIWGDSS